MESLTPLVLLLAAAVAWGGCGPGFVLPDPPPRADGPDAPKATNPKSLVLISVDTLRADHLSAYGYARETSPRVDALAAEGVLFERAFSQSPKTASSHMSLMTGLYPEAHGVENYGEGGGMRMSAQIPTLATLLQRAGYRTFAFTGGGNVTGRFGFDQGFEIYENALGVERAFRLGTEAVEALSRAGRGESAAPFFLFLHTYAVHDPYTPPARYAAPFVDPGYDGKIIRSGFLLRLITFSTQWRSRHKAFWERVDRGNEQDRRHLVDLYDGTIRYTDDQIGKFLSRFEELGLDKEAVVVFLSDHGEEFYEHKGFLHDCVYQEVLHVPLIIRFPAGEPGKHSGRRSPEVARLVDVMPTILEYVGLPIPEDLQGRSLLPLLLGEESTPRPVLSQWRWRKTAVLQDRGWKYIRGRDKDELYDLAADPGEKRNLASREPDRGRVLREEIEALLAESQSLHDTFHPGGKVEPDARTLRDLKALGYVGGDGSPAPGRGQ